MRTLAKPGQRIKGVRCAECGALAKARLWRDRFRWMARIDCGHDKEIGYTLPVEELERRGLVNQENPIKDPRIAQRNAHIKEQFERREFEKIVKLLKGVSHWMDKAGMLRSNPCYGLRSGRIEQMKKLRMNQAEMEDVYNGILRLLRYMKTCGGLPHSMNESAKIAETIGGRSVMEVKTNLDSEGNESPVTTTMTVERFDPRAE